jgi:hypothetical protein
MLKKLLIPCFVFAAAVAIGQGGCSSDTPKTTTGKGGNGGSSAGSSGGSHAGTSGGSTAGSSAGSTAGSSGGSSAAGTGGSTAGSSGGTGGTGGSAAGTSGGTGGTTDGGAGAGGMSGADGGGNDTGGDVTASCTSSVSQTGTALSAEAFCANVVAKCTATSAGIAVPGGYTMDMCMATYTARTGTQKSCQSYHLCWGVEGKGGGPGSASAHCPHAWGGGPCN